MIMLKENRPTASTTIYLYLFISFAILIQRIIYLIQKHRINSIKWCFLVFHCCVPTTNTLFW